MPKPSAKGRYWNPPKNRHKQLWGASTASPSGSGTPRHPPGLKGKAIGLFYRDLARNKKKQDFCIKFAIPQPVVNRVRVLLQAISNTKEGKEVKEQFLKTFGNSLIFTKSGDEFKKPEPIILPKIFPLEVKNEETPYEYPERPKIKEELDSNDPQASCSTLTVKPGSSLAPDFIYVKNEASSSYDSSYSFKPLRDSGDHFKFGYHDLITGTFEEKLDQCLSNGVTIQSESSGIKRLNETYYCEYENMLQKNKYREMLEFRKKLPTYKKSQDLLEIIENNQVVVISGETGCGKSTQIPQIILNDAICKKRGANTKIMVTQPRRIAASSLAARVAEERAEKIGLSVGYSVRLESIEPRSTGSITYCTTGVLLVQLETNQGLTDITHVILDEVHERDTHVDLTMCVLKQVIEKRKDLKVILMSATLDAERLSQYFNDCPVMHIEGLAYPVKDIFLEEILDITKFTLEESKPNSNVRHRHGGKQSMMKNEIDKDITYKSEVGPWLNSIKGQLDPKIYRTLMNFNIEEIQIPLILALIKHICNGEPGAILVFLPGIGEITKLLKEMNEHAFPRSRYEIYPLHSKLASLEQHRIFARPPAGVRKIIIATNIAETSLTIDDVVYVVDCAKIKVKGLNVEDNVTTLVNEWVAQANLHQRRGRAGRCQPGVCYHLVSTFRANKLEVRKLPELQRSDLLEAVLSIKKLRLGKAADALGKVPDPPALSTIEWAVSHLRQCGALDDNESLTPLGWHMARLPAHPAAGKLMILGALFGCLNRAAAVASVWGFKDPFQLVIGREREADDAKRSFTLGEPSDHVAMSEAILRWEQLGYERRSFAYKNFLSNNTLELLVDMKKQFGNNLKQMGFLPSGDIRSTWENRNKDNLSLFKAIVAASLYPNIASVSWTRLHSRNMNKPPRMIVRLLDRKVPVHPSSVMSMQHFQRVTEKPGANWLTYWLKQKSNELYLIDVNLVYTLPLLFFGELNITNVEDSQDECFISISKYKVRCQKETTRLLFELRSLLDHVLANKVATYSDHSVRDNEFERSVLNAVIEMITAEDEQTQYVSEDDNSESDSESRPRF